MGYPTCPLEIEIRRRNSEERALRFPEVEGDSLEIERLRRQFQERVLRIPDMKDDPLETETSTLHWEMVSVGSP